MGGEAWVGEREERVRESARKDKSSGGGEVSAKVSLTNHLLCSTCQDSDSDFVAPSQVRDLRTSTSTHSFKGARCKQVLQI